MTENEVLHTVLNHTEALVYVIDINNYEVLYANAKCINEFGDVLGKTCYQVLQTNQGVPCSFCPLNHVESQNLLHEGMSYQWEHFNTKNKKHYTYHDHILQWNGHKRLAKIQVGIDITEQKRLEKILQDEQNTTLETLKSVINTSLEGILLFDEDSVCIFANDTAQTLFNYTQDELLIKKLKDFFISKENELSHFSTTKHSWEATMFRKGNIPFIGLVRQNEIILRSKKLHILAVLDISGMKQKEEEILYMAFHDTLTALPNRAFFAKEVHKCLDRLHKHSSYFALLFLDLDHFKTINDTKGHDVGDRILIETANRLKSALRSNDIAARIGGDEFAILIDTRERSKDKAAKNIFALSQHLLETIKAPMSVDNLHFLLTISIGVALFNTTLYSFEELMKYADSAMYQAKEHGRNKVMFFDPLVQKRLESKAETLNRLRKAACTGELKLFYQPQILSNATKQSTIGVEALVRWIDPERGIIPPSEFIGLAEEHGCIIQLGEWILKEAFSQLKKWEKDPFKKEWRMSINISIKQLERDNFVTMVQSLLQEIACSPQKIRFELTENILIKNTQINIQKMRALKKLGISLSIDDVGVGYSSLAYLKKLPIHELKIDRSFIKEILTNPADTIIVQMIIDIAHYFKIDVIAEGVETKEQYQKLKIMGCTHFQGFLFSKPLHIDHLHSHRDEQLHKIIE